MPVRIRITLLFALMVLSILSLVCLSVYYFSSLSRVNNIKTRLTNRAITTARLLGQSSIFNLELMRRIDSATALAMKHKTIQVYDYLNNVVYRYSDSLSDTIHVEKKMLDEARAENNLYFNIDGKDMIVHHFVDQNVRLVVLAAASDETGKKNLDQLKLILWISFAGGIVISVVGGYIFSGKLLEPIRKITNEVNEISARNLTTRINTAGVQDEWNSLSQTLNQLLNRLQDSFELQQRFISNASHELSTPLTAISSQLEVALQRERAVPEYQKIMQSIYQDVLNLNNLTRTLLEFAKASGHPGGLPIEPVRVDEILMEIPAWIKKIDPGYKLLLSFEQLPADEEKLLVEGNKDLLSTAIKNIISNACKYSANHLAYVNLEVSKNQLIIRVRDEGIGIPDDDLKNIFQPFFRTEETRFEPGFGLGLSLAHRIVKLHKGHIEVESSSGRGALFIIFLPMSSTDAV